MHVYDGVSSARAVVGNILQRRLPKDGTHLRSLRMLQYCYERCFNLTEQASIIPILVDLLVIWLLERRGNQSHSLREGRPFRRWYPLFESEFLHPTRRCLIGSVFRLYTNRHDPIVVSGANG